MVLPSIIIARSMIAEESPLSRVRLGENGCVKLEFVQIRWVFLGDHPIRIMDLHEVADFGTRIGGTTMPNFTPKKHYVTRIA